MATTGGFAFTDPIALNQFREIVDNASSSRSQLLQKLIDPRRDYDQECGYPDTANITPQQYRDWYDRDPVAAQVVAIMPHESWKVLPEVYEDEDVDTETPFEQTFDAVCNSLRGKSWYQAEGEQNPLWDYLCRLDELSGIGSYGILLMGIDDGKPLDQPAELGEKQSPTRKLLYLRPFDEAMAPILSYETDKNSPRYGQPTMYQVSLSDPSDGNKGGIGAQTATVNVHWTRVIHVAGDLGSSEIFGVPRMRPVFNRLMDLRKLYGGSAEMYWRGAFPGVSLETHPQLGGDVAIDQSALQDTMENYMNGLQRYLSLMGMTAKTLSPTVVDPTPQINVHLDAICINRGVPKRIFLGSERGELASTQDAQAWSDRLQSRRNRYLTSRLIVPLVDRLISLGVLPAPDQYSVVWSDTERLTLQEQATVAVSRTDALVKYVQGGVESLITPLYFLTRILGIPDTEARQILESTLDMLRKEDKDAGDIHDALTGGGTDANADPLPPAVDGDGTPQPPTTP
ncbi:MAG: anti-CBASS Acb1 family protein [Opitutaceae bacterium]